MALHGDGSESGDDDGDATVHTVDLDSGLGRPAAEHERPPTCWKRTQNLHGLPLEVQTYTEDHTNTAKSASMTCLLRSHGRQPFLESPCKPLEIRITMFWPCHTVLNNMNTSDAFSICRESMWNVKP